ncbi:hypothetical protein KGQ72_00405 [Patescibacteria group bacterium]|nr:hypothetical protein [Patescibacteria group bacterium]
MNRLVLIWAIATTAIAAALGILHFANPYPLIQIPDKGHRLYATPDERTNDLMVHVFSMAGIKPYGTFTAGPHQTLMRDGVTVLAYGEGIKGAGISFPVDDPMAAATSARKFLAQNGVQSSIMMPSKELGDKLVVLQLPFGWDIAYRLPGKDMPPPVWERKY